MRWWMIVAAGCLGVLGGALWFAASDPEPVPTFAPAEPHPAPTAAPAPVATAPAAPPAPAPTPAEPFTGRKDPALPPAPVVVAPPPAPPVPAPVVLPSALGATAPGGAISNGVAEMPAADDEGWEDEAPAMKTLPLPSANVRQRTSDVVARQRLREAAAQIRGATIQR